MPVTARMSGRRVAVTGAGGFIGSHLSEALVEEGAKVRAMVRYNARDDRGALAWADSSLVDEMEISAGDVRSPESVAEVIERSDLVFHLAAQIAIPYSYLDPRSFFETNVLGTLNVSQACRSSGVERLVHVSTSEVYGTASELPITEDHRLSGQSPYAASKIGADQIVSSFARTYALPATIVRPFNTYGPRQSARALIPTIISQALRGGPVSLGALEPRRDFTYVTDTVRGMLDLAGADEALDETVQLASERELSVEELVEELGRVMDRELEVARDEARVRPERSEVVRLLGSAERARRLTGWGPQVPLADGLAETVSWIAAHPHRYRTEERVL
jgi:NAD dependent epimerase/dehydratase